MGNSNSWPWLTIYDFNDVKSEILLQIVSGKKWQWRFWTTFEVVKDKDIFNKISNVILPKASEAQKLTSEIALVTENGGKILTGNINSLIEYYISKEEE